MATEDPHMGIDWMCILRKSVRVAAGYADVSLMLRVRAAGTLALQLLKCFGRMVLVRREMFIWL